MARVFYIYDKIGWLNTTPECPLGITEVYEQEYYEKHPGADGTEPEFEDNRPTGIHTMTYEDQLTWAMKVLKVNGKETDIKISHGDVVWIGGDQYRNQGIHFWDAKEEKIIPMATHRGDYGHVPKRFAVGKGEGEFSPRHWDGISYYNNLQPYWSSEKKTWFFPLEYAEDGGSDDEYYQESD
jgi:hypothetical protein